MIDSIKRHWLYCLLTVLAMLGEVCIDLQLPDLMRVIIDEGVLKQSREVIQGTGLTMLGLVLCGMTCGVVASFWSQIVSQDVGDTLRKRFFSKVMRLSFAQIDRLSTGSLITRLSNDINQVQITIVVFLRAVVRSSILFFGGLFMIYRESLWFGFMVTAILPVVAVLLRYFMKGATPMFMEVQRRLDHVNNLVDESLAGCRVIKAYVKETYEQERFAQANASLCGMDRKVQKFLACMSPFMNILFNLCVIAILLVGAWLVRDSRSMQPGQMIASITYVAIIMHGMLFMAYVFQFLTKAKVSFERVREVLEQEDEGQTEERTVESVNEHRGGVEFSHVSFRYPGAGDKAVLEDISLSIAPGETVAVIGATGCGKSSLVHLIPRFYDAESGDIQVDGRSVQDYSLQELREKIAIVMQNSELYSRSIGENIALGRPMATADDIRKAASIAQAEAFIVESPDGFDTMVSQKGHSLSGGQKQRLSIARALLKRPEILILDDATSALDTRTEAEFYRCLRQEFPEMTKIIIGQRVSTVRQADRIVVMEHGRIVACGTHRQLLEDSAVYRDIVDSQMNREEVPDHGE